MVGGGAGGSSGAPMGSADKASKVKSLLASYYDLDDAEEPSNSLFDTPRHSPSPGGRPPLSPGIAPSPGAGGADAAALNASYFDPEAYLRRVLKETRLAELAARQRDMAAEVGGLDSDMQMLVYENYSKFITATDTIRAMSSSMQGMDGRMHELRGLIDGVVATSDSVHGKLQQRQQEVEELGSVRALLHRLQAVFDLPRKLRAAIDRQALEVAADAYADAAPLLSKFGHKGAFKQVAAEVEVCGRELAGLLRRRLLAAPDQAAETIQMIAKLGEPTESLQEDFLECKRQRLEGLLAAAGLMLKTLAVEQGLLSPSELGSVDEGLRQRMLAMFPPAEGAPPGSLPSLHAVIVELDGRFITETTHTAALFAELFPPGGRKRLVKMARECFARYLKLTRRALSDASAIAAAAAAGISSQGEPLQPVEGWISGAEAAAEGEEGGAGGAAQDSIAADWGTAHLLQSLYVVRTDLQRLDSLLPELSPRDRGSELVEHTVRQHVSLCFAALERRLVGTAQVLGSALAQPDARRNGEPKRRLLVHGLALLQELLTAGVERLLRSLKEYERQVWVLSGWSEVFVNAVHGQVSNLFLSLCQQLLSVAQLQAPPTLGSAVTGSARSTVESAAPFAALQRRPTLTSEQGGEGGAAPPPPPLLLLLCRLCRFAEAEAVGSALMLLQQLYPERLLSGGEELPAFQPTELGRQLSAASSTLLQGYVAAHASILTLAASTTTQLTDWMHHKEPRAPREVCGLVLGKVEEADVEASYLIDGPGPTAGGRMAHLHHSRAPSAGSADASLPPMHSHGSSRASGGMDSYFEASVGRMLSGGRDRGGLELSRPAVAAALLQAALRALVDELRRQTLGRAAFQQVQLDVHYLRPELQRLVAGSADGPAVVQLLDELMAVAMERCLEPLLLESNVLDRILSQAAAGKAAAGGGVSLL